MSTQTKTTRRLYRQHIQSATVEQILGLYGLEVAATGSGFMVVRNVYGVHIIVDVQEGFSPRGAWLASKFTDNNVWAVNAINRFAGLARKRLASRDYHPDSGIGMAHVSYQSAFRALTNVAEFVVMLTPDMLRQMGATDAEIFTQLGLNTGHTIQKVLNGIEGMPGAALPVWKGEHCGQSLRDSFFHRDLHMSLITNVLLKGTWWQAPSEENFSVIKSAAAKIITPSDGSMPYIEGASTGCHEMLTRFAVNANIGVDRTEVVIVSGDDSEYCDLATVLDLIALGYIVIVAYEAMAPLDEDAEAVAFAQMQDAGAIFASVDVLREANEIYVGLVAA
jgi:nicotinamidase-related amidase